MTKPATNKRATPTTGEASEPDSSIAPKNSSKRVSAASEDGTRVDVLPNGGSVPDGEPTTSPQSAPRPHTKGERLLKLLQAGTGVSLEEMVEATGWQSHTVRAAMTGLRKRGYEIERHTEGNTSVWSAKGKDQ